MIFKIRKRLSTFLIDHIKQLYFQTDPILDVSHRIPISKCSKSRHYYFSLLVIILTILFGTIGLDYSYYELNDNNIASFDLSELHNSSHIFTHQMVPYNIWNLNDIGWLLDTASTFGVIVALILTKDVTNEFKLYINEQGNILVGNRVLEKAESSKILLNRKLIKLAFQLGCGVMYFGALFIFWAYVFVMGESTNMASIIFWVVGFPLYYLYIVFALLFISGFIILACRYIRIRQKYLLQKFTKLNTELTIPTKHLNSIKLRQFWRTYSAYNRTILHICGMIQEYSRFGVSILSILIPFYISLQCYLLYVAAFAAETPLIERQLCLFVVLEVNLYLFILIEQCSAVDAGNTKLEVQNRRFYLNYLRIGGFNVVHTRNLLKAESLQTHRRLHLYAFKVNGGRRITSNTFELIISYISIFFMYVFKSQ